MELSLLGRGMPRVSRRGTENRSWGGGELHALDLSGSHRSAARLFLIVFARLGLAQSKERLGELFGDSLSAIGAEVECVTATKCVCSSTG